jgi:hypothetical protein
MEDEMKRVATILTITTALAIAATPALAQRRGAALASANPASVYAIHAISGDDLGLARALPVFPRFRAVPVPAALRGASRHHCRQLLLYHETQFLSIILNFYQ